MKRVLIAVLLVCFCWTSLLSQTLSPTPMNFGAPATSDTVGQETPTTLLSSIPALQGIASGKIVTNPFVSVGYQWISSNLTLPASANPRGPNQLFVGPVEIKLEDFNFWVGTAGLNIMAAPITLFASISGNSPRLFGLSGQIPVTNAFGAIAPTVTFTGSNVQFWAAQTGASYTFWRDYSIVAGYAWSHTGAEFTDPRIGQIPLPNQTLRGDVGMDLGIPFVGVQILQEGSFRAAFLYSPLATSTGTLSLQTASPDVARLSYTLNQPGTFCSANLEYYAVFKPPVICSCWFTATYVNIRGSSDLALNGAFLNEGREVDIVNTQYGLAGGLTFGLAF